MDLLRRITVRGEVEGPLLETGIRIGDIRLERGVAVNWFVQLRLIIGGVCCSSSSRWIR